jgi:glycosyltransferase involved in cell wall biosynthesis
LPATLLHLAAQVLDGVAWEVVIIDNRSVDDTVGVAVAEWERLGNVCPIRTFTELEQGTGFARVTGIKEAQYEYVLFCDDDNWLADDYILRSLQIMKNDSTVGMCGGRAEAVFENNYQPEWFGQYAAVFACGPVTTNDGYLDWSVMTMYSAGMTIRRDAAMTIIESGYRFLLTGRRANSFVGSGEDSELVIALRLLGYKAYYTNELVFRHYMTEGRMKWPYLRDIIYGASLSTAQLFIYADVTRYTYTRNARYKVSWLRDILKAAYGAFLIPVKRPQDLQIVWIKLKGGLYSVISNIPNYSRYKKQIIGLYKLTHKDD